MIVKHMVLNHRLATRIFKPALLLIGVTTLSACGSMELFQTDREFDRRVYAGGGVLLSRLEPDTSDVSGVSVDESNSSGAALLLGYDLSNRFSLEGHVADLGESTFKPDGSISYQVAGVSGVLYGFNDVRNRSYRQGLAAFGRLGMGTMNNDAEVVRHKRVNDIHFLVGAGLEYGFDNGFAARAELIAHETDAKYAQLALLYRFGTDRGRRSIAAAPTVPSADSVELRTPDPSVESPERQESGVLTPPLDAANVQSPDVAVTPVPSSQLEVLENAASSDTDLDGISDEIDTCPGTTSGLPVNDTGCEIFQGVMEGVTFLTGSADLTDDAIEVLSSVVESLREYPDVRLTIEAHTDNAGDAIENLQLSRRRALAVARFFVDQGIPGSRLRPQAFGESQPRATNTTAKGRSLNRRVEFSILQ